MEARKLQPPKIKNKLYDKVLKKFGIEHQTHIAIEEYSEVIKELTKMLRGQGINEHLAEELADACIVTEQMIEFYGLTESVRWWKEFKTARLETIVNNEREN